MPAATQSQQRQATRSEAERTTPLLEQGSERNPSLENKKYELEVGSFVKLHMAFTGASTHVHLKLIFRIS